MRICYGTFATVIKLCALNGITQLDIHDALLASLDPKDRLGLSRDNTQATRWFKCQTNLNPKLIKAARYIRPEEAAENFSDLVMDLIEPNKKATASLAICAIIKRDESIMPETVVDLVTNTRKADLVKGSIPLSPEFLAGVLLYAVSIGRNKEGKPYISQIKNDFIKIADDNKYFSEAFKSDMLDYSAPENSLAPSKVKKVYVSHLETAYKKVYTILPVYLVIDTSYSMNDGNKFNMALSFLPKLLSVMIESSSLSDKIRVEVITFDEDAKVSLPLGGLDDIEKWITQNKTNPIVPNGRHTYYGKTFEKIKSEIQKGVRKIQSETVDSVTCKAYRPVVFFITDGKPNDEPFSRNKAFLRLIEQNFEYRPNLICVGVGEASYDDLLQYGSGRYNSPTGSYITGNDKLVIVPRDGILPSQALKSIIPALVASIVQSLSNATSINDTNGVPDLFSSQDDLFEDLDLKMVCDPSALS